MPTCWICLKELSEKEFAGGEAHDCQATTLGEPGPDIPSSDCDPLVSAPRAALPASPSNEPSKSRSRSPALEIIRRGTIRRLQTLDRSLEQSGVSHHRSPARSLPPLSGPAYQRHRRHTSSAKTSGQRSLPAIPEEESEPEPSPEVTPTRPSTRRLPIPPSTPGRRILLIQEYADRDEDLRSIISRLDDAIASSPELWTSGLSEGIDGQPIPPLQFYRRLHEFHQQRIASGAPSSIPCFFPRLGAKQHEW